MMDPVAVFAARLVVAGVLLQAAVAKLRAPLQFEPVLEEYRLLPPWAVPVVARALPLLEAVAAVALLLPATAALGGALALALLLAFTAAIGINLARGRKTIDCGCGGPAQPLSPALLARNAALLLLALLAAATPAPRVLGAADIAILLCLGATLAALYAAATQLLANAGAMRRGA